MLTGRFTVKQSGHALLTVKPRSGGQETYLITLREFAAERYTSSADLGIAALRIEGIVWGSPYVELTDKSAIQSSTGFTVAVSGSPILPLHECRC
jgi:hypothetical protein